PWRRGFLVLHDHLVAVAIGLLPCRQAPRGPLLRGLASLRRWEVSVSRGQALFLLDTLSGMGCSREGFARSGLRTGSRLDRGDRLEPWPFWADGIVSHRVQISFRRMRAAAESPASQQATVVGSGTGCPLINCASWTPVVPVEFDERAACSAWAAAWLNVAFGSTIIAQFAFLASM